MDDADIDMDNSSNSNFFGTFCQYLILFSSFWHDELRPFLIGRVKYEFRVKNKNPEVNKSPEYRSPGAPQ